MQAVRNSRVRGGRVRDEIENNPVITIEGMHCMHAPNDNLKASYAHVQFYLLTSLMLVSGLSAEFLLAIINGLDREYCILFSGGSPRLATR